MTRLGKVGEVIGDERCSGVLAGVVAAGAAGEKVKTGGRIVNFAVRTR